MKALALALLAPIAIGTASHAYAQPIVVHPVYIDAMGSEWHDIALLSEMPTDLPVCAYEDGSDALSLPCVWTDTDTGNAYLTYADRSYLVLDDTTVPHLGTGLAPGPVA